MYEEFEMGDPAARRRAAIAAEKDRLARDRERRESRDRTAVSGFLRRKWAWLGVTGDAVTAVHGVLDELSAVPGLPAEPRAVLRAAAAGAPDREALLPAVRRALEHAAPEEVLAHVRALWDADIPWLTDAGAERCRVICSSAPSLLLVSGRARAVSGGAAFSLFAAAATRGAVPVPTRHLPDILSWAPLPVLDDLVDHGGLLPEDRPWADRDPDEALYLRARLVPGKVTAQEAAALEWTDYLRREAFLSGAHLERLDPADLWDLLYDVVADGDVTRIDELDALLPRTQQIQLRDLRSGAINGEWPRETVADTGLWLLMASLWQPRESVSPQLSPFHALVALNRAYDLLKAGRLEEAGQQAARFEKGGTGRKPGTGLRQEALTIRAYVAAVEGDLAQAEALTEAAVGLGEQAEANLALVRTWRATPKNRRDRVTNPFIELGLDHGSFRWEKHCRELFREAEGDHTEQARINDAEERIRAAQGAEAGLSVFFRIPLEPDRYLMPDSVPATLVPPVAALPRRTPAVSGAELERIRARAAVELLDDLRSTPPRLDRHDRRA
ncbi:hypothetical protein [Streptomyces sp. NRRL WC-3744]|uniref:hypothetical protein n=2 Tax=unclassified Streptomyces TaxID=2593676 RepID=UPI0004C87E12|nr:hypothetical protein [Streptomyces sp. NRRL WC-3744]